jgi:short repeat uncharacterized protein DUF308
VLTRPPATTARPCALLKIGEIDEGPRLTLDLERDPRRCRRCHRRRLAGITIGAFILFAVYTFVAAGMDDVATGVVALAWPGIAALALVIWVAAWALVTGVAEIALASTSPEMQVNVPCSD